MSYSVRIAAEHVSTVMDWCVKSCKQSVQIFERHENKTDSVASFDPTKSCIWQIRRKDDYITVQLEGGYFEFSADMEAVHCKMVFWNY